MNESVTNLITKTDQLSFMKKLFVFDVDRTLLTQEMDDESDYVKGVITTERLDQLEKQGHCVCITSPSPFVDKRYRDGKHWIKNFESNDDRWLAVKNAMNLHGFNAENTIYIDDSEELRKQVKGALGIKVLSPEEFLQSIQSIKV